MNKNVVNCRSLRNASDPVPSLEQMAAVLNGAVSTEPPKEFRMISWNVDGLDNKVLKLRTEAVIEVIQKYVFSSLCNSKIQYLFFTLLILSCFESSTHLWILVSCN